MPAYPPPPITTARDQNPGGIVVYRPIVPLITVAAHPVSVLGLPAAAPTGAVKIFVLGTQGVAEVSHSRAAGAFRVALVVAGVDVVGLLTHCGSRTMRSVLGFWGLARGGRGWGCAREWKVCRRFCVERKLI